MLANELREIASKVSNEDLKRQVDSAAEYLESLSLVEAKRGAFGLKVPLHKIPFTGDVLTRAFTLLRKKGYVCYTENEITAWYSNTDCDSEDVLIMKW